MNQVLLDGKFVEEKIIDPTKHKFIGMFRTPSQPYSPGADVYNCPCGWNLETVNGVHEHWSKGHFDTPQYVSIVREEGNV